MDKDEILLKEYEICQQDSSAMVSIQWTAFGIIIGINTAILGALGYGLISLIGVLSVGDKWLVSIFGMGLITILVFLKFWMKRVSWLVSINNHRMREIEVVLRIRKNLLVECLDDKSKWNSLSNEEKGNLYLRDLRRKRPLLTGICCAKGFLYTLIALWVVFIIVVAIGATS